MMNDFRYQLLKQRRDFLGLTCLDVAKRLYEHKVNVSDDTVRNWEAGTTTPDADLLPAIADVLKCKVHEFYT